MAYWYKKQREEEVRPLFVRSCVRACLITDRPSKIDHTRAVVPYQAAQFVTLLLLYLQLGLVDRTTLWPSANVAFHPHLPAIIALCLTRRK